MQPVVAVLLASWIGGIILGTTLRGLIGFLLDLAALILLIKLYRANNATAVALIAASVLGFSYGNWDRPDLELICATAEKMHGRVVVRPDIRENSVRYLIDDDKGCHYFVYAERWPVLERDTLVTITGGRFRERSSILAEEPDFGQYLIRQKVSGAWYYPRVAVETFVNTDHSYRAALTRVHTLFIEPDASLIGAMMFAERGHLSLEMTDYFRRTGLTHILSISGAHISLLTGMIFALVYLLPLKPLIKTLLIVGLLWGYVWFVGAPVSAVRAGFFWSVALLAMRLGLLVSLPTAMILTLTIMLTWQPRLALDISLQLSFMAVVGIFLALFITKPWRARLPQTGVAIATPVIVSLGATAMTWPLVSYYFETISLSTPLANLLIIPAVLIIMGGSVAVIAVSYMSILAGRLLTLPIHAAVVWMLWVAETLGRWPGTWLSFTIPGWAMGLYYACLLVTLIYAPQLQGRTWREAWE